MTGHEKTTNIVKLILAPIVYFVLSQGITIIYTFYVSFKLGLESNGQMGSLTDFQNNIMNMVMDKTMLLTLIGAAIAIPIMYFVFYDKKEGSCEKKSSYVWVALLGIGACVVLNVIISISGLPNLSKTYQELSELIYTGNFWLELVTAGMIVPIAEELIFRGIMFKRLKAVAGIAWAVTISSVVFGIMHGNLVQFTYAAVLGAVLCLVYVRCKNILAPILLHMSANTISVLLSDCKPVAELMESPIISLLFIFVCLILSIVTPILIIKNTRAEENTNVSEDEIPQSAEDQQ